MKAALALVFLACIAGSMAANPVAEIGQQLLAQGQAVVQSVLGLLQQQITAVAQQAAQKIAQLAQALGGRADIFQELFATIMGSIKPHLDQLLGNVLGSLGSMLGGGRAGLFDSLQSVFTDFINSIKPAVGGMVSHLTNQGLSAVLGSLGGLGGRIDFSEIFSTLGGHITNLTNVAKETIAGALGNLQAIGSNMLGAAKPHWEQLQESLVGHGLNVLGSLSDTINNLHGSITGGR